MSSVSRASSASLPPAHQPHTYQLRHRGAVYSVVVRPTPTQPMTPQFAAHLRRLLDAVSAERPGFKQLRAHENGLVCDGKPYKPQRPRLVRLLAELLDLAEGLAQQSRFWLELRRT